MGYYHIELSPYSKTLCTIVLPFGKYEYQRLPMGLCNSPDIFQEKMSELFDGLDFVRTYIDDLLCCTDSTFTDHLEKLREIFKRLREAGLKVNARKSFFAKTELEYLGYWITRDGIQPLAKKVEAIKAMTEPNTKSELRKFIGMVNYYRDMWIRRSHTLAPLTKLCSKEAKWQWTDLERQAFNDMKNILSRHVLLSYPDFKQPFVIHTDASHTQLGGVISQNNKPIAFYSRKLNPAQTRYTTTERELLSIVETLKEFRNILLGQKIIVHTDHKNLTYATFNTERVMRWRLLIEEYGPELHYVKGEHNIVADALSRLNRTNTTPVDTPELNVFTNSVYALAKKDITEVYSLKYAHIEKAQQQDESLKKLVQSREYSFTVFHGGGREFKLITRNDRIVLPKVLQQKCAQWYHLMLMHPGTSRMELTISQHYYWPNLKNTVIDVCKKCQICQLSKKSMGPKYGLLPPKEAEVKPWDILCVDLIGPYTIQRKKRKELTLHCLTMIDPATGWFEIVPIENKTAAEVANQIELTWMTRYPWPTQVILDRGKEFMGEFMELMQTQYGIKRKAITTRNPQANAIIERVHKTIANMIRTARLQNNNEENPWPGLLAAIMFAVRATVHTTLGATPSQLVFGRDAILNTQFVADWQYIKQKKQNIINKNNEKENAKRKEYQYHVGDKVKVKNSMHNKFGEDPYTGPYTVTKVYNNGTLRLRKRTAKGALYQTYNIRNVEPYNV
jgi:hypothetical protein